MNYRNPELREQLAGEYVLGTLKGRARRRFERLLRDDATLRDSVAAWERRLTPLVEAVPPIAPPKRAWEEIERRIAPASRDTTRPRVAFWRPAALLAGALALVLAVYVYFLPAPSAPVYVAVLNDQQSQPAWLVSAADVSHFTVKAVKTPAQATDRAYELWLLPGGDKPPRSLGLLPTEGEKTVVVPAELREMLASGKTLAVSVEPPGGSPTGLPTGPVLYQGVLVRAG